MLFYTMLDGKMSQIDAAAAAAAATTDDGISNFNNSENTLYSAASTISAYVGSVDSRLSAFVILRTICYWIVFVVGNVGNVLVLILIIQLRNRKQVSYDTVCNCR